MRISQCIFPFLFSVATAFSASMPGIDPNTPPVGYVVHPREAKYAEVSQTPATAELSNLFGWKMKDREKQIVDFETPQQWIDMLYQSKRSGYPILDTSLLHSFEDWRQKLTRDVNENSIDASGKILGWSSMYSPTFRKSVLNYIDQLIDWIKEKDTQHRIPVYVDGAEWFWPWAELDYNPLTVQAFGLWLKERYSSIEKLNNEWGADFKTWQDVQPPKITIIGEFSVGWRPTSFYGNLEYFWESPSLPITPRREYVVRVNAQLKDVPKGLACIQFRWYDSDKKLLTDVSEPEKGESQAFEIIADSNSWRTTRAIAKAPVNAKTLGIGLKLFGRGSAKFTQLEVSEWPSTHSLYVSDDANKTEVLKNWQLVKNGKYGEGAIEYKANNASPIFALSASTPKPPCKYSGVAWEDWNVFSFESMANWLNLTAKHIKQRDPSRLVSSYVGWTWGTLSMWDGCMTIQRLDISLANTPDININGIQMCIADRDFSYATCPIDMARKYNKPINATDLVDFPYGLYSGFEPIYRGVLASVQHGMDGMFSYCWYGNYPKSYNYATNLTASENKRLLEDAITAIRLVQKHELTTDVALLLPLMTYSIEDYDGFKSDPLDSTGMYHLILDIGLIPDVVTPYEIAKLGPDILKKYKTIFLPDCPVLTANVNNALVSFVEKGGTIVGCGRWPTKDIRGDTLALQLVNKTQGQDLRPESVVTQPHRAELARLSSPLKIAREKGTVVWFKNKVGASYLGNVRRWRVSGNTPAVVMQTDFSENAIALRRYIRTTANDTLAQLGMDRTATFDAADGTINMSVYKQDVGQQEVLLFITNTGYGRNPGFELTLHQTLRNATCEAIIDFEKPVSLNAADVTLSVPPFSHSCILTLKPSRASK